MEEIEEKDNLKNENLILIKINQVEPIEEKEKRERKISLLSNNTKSISPDYFLEWKNINYYIKDFNKDKRSNSLSKDSNNNVVVAEDDYLSEDKKSKHFNSNYDNVVTAETKSPEELADFDEMHRDSNRTIINNMSGFASPKEILVIMGPSGSGKTSLLNIIADRQLPTDRKTHVINREVTVNNIKVDKSYGMLFAYIMQDDVLLDTLTPKELLLFAARLKLNINYFKAMKKVQDLINKVINFNNHLIYTKLIS